jgi:hypothetical protein
MNVRKLLTHNNILESIIFTTKLNKNTVHLGRWNVEYSNIIINRKIDLANSDNSVCFIYKNENTNEKYNKDDKDDEFDEYLKYMF